MSWLLDRLFWLRVALGLDRGGIEFRGAGKRTIVDPVYVGRNLACWADRPREGRPELLPATCLLPDGHEALGIDHEWTPDCELLMDFPEAL